MVAGLLVLTLLAGASAMLAADEDPIDATRQAIDKWIETRKAIAKERRDLILKKEMLRERIDVVQREIDAFRKKIEDKRKSVAEAEAKRKEMTQKNEKLKDASAAVGASIAGLETQTLELVKRIPKPLAESVSILTQRFPKDPNKPTKEQTLGVRYQNLIGTLTQINKANRELRLVSEQIPLPDGTSAEVQALYIGLGESLYASANGKYAGVGTVGANGWEWTPANESAREIARVIAIVKSEDVAAFVPVPVDIK